MSKISALFPAQEKDQLVTKLWQHPFIFLRLSVFFLILAVLPLGVDFLLDATFPAWTESASIYPALLLCGFAYYLLILLFALFVWTDNYLDYWTITNKRIVSRKQNGLFNRTVSELELYRVQDVTVEQKGLWATLLNFGDLYIQTAGAEERFVFHNAAHPTETARLIQKLDAAEKQKINRPGAI